MIKETALNWILYVATGLIRSNGIHLPNYETKIGKNAEWMFVLYVDCVPVSKYSLLTVKILSVVRKNT